MKTTTPIICISSSKCEAVSGAAGAGLTHLAGSGACRLWELLVGRSVRAGMGMRWERGSRSLS